VAATSLAGLDSAAAADTVLVACGTYYEYDIVMKAGITLRGETGDPACVIIDALAQGRVLDCADFSTQAVIAGMTFTGGQSAVGVFPESMGGGIRCQNSRITITNCVFSDNSAQYGGGLGLYLSTGSIDSCTFNANVARDDSWAGGGGLWCRESSPALTYCTFSANTAFSTNLPGDGGGVFCKFTSLTATDCTFIGNSTGGGAGGMYSFDADESVLTRCHFEDNYAYSGGGMYMEGSLAQLYDCTFESNSATLGGAILMGEISEPELNDCIFLANEANPGAAGAIDCWQSNPIIRRCLFLSNIGTSRGGGMAFGTNAQPQLIDCVFYDNVSPNQGGAISCRYWVHIQLTNCTLVGNSAPIGSGIAYDVSATATLDNTIIAFNSPGESIYGEVRNAVSPSCCNIFGNSGGDWVEVIEDWAGLAGNFSADPLFCDEVTGDLTLDASSPCLDAAGCGLVGALDQGCDLVFVGENLPLSLPRLRQNYPNPFNPSTVIDFALPRAGFVRLAVLSVDGQHVTTLVERSLPAGNHRFTWDGRDSSGHSVSSGIYLYRLETADRDEIKKMVLVR
jgi:predicted outer membrane repeat protein